MSKIALQVENLSKAYQLGEIGTGTISRDLERWWARIRGKEDPFLRIGETNDRETRGENDIVWSLKDLNFEIEQGDAVGIIGRNGAGKSTLLKILSRITSPTTGKIYGNGRVASLLEVGTGFNPELTGRENIYLNGTIMGMRKSEIRRQFDAIVDFAGVERYIDTPVKRYSSGMYVRLAFAVAAHLESEILILDEVLAVGDAEFQKKCLGKMEDVSKSEGRTILFVSHNLQAVQALCTKGLLLKNGSLEKVGPTHDIIEEYLSENFSNVISRSWDEQEYQSSAEARFVRIYLSADNTNWITTNEVVTITLETNYTKNYKSVYYAIQLHNSQGIVVFDTASEYYNVNKGKHTVTCEIPGNFLNNGVYTISACVYREGNIFMCEAHNVLHFKIEDGTRNIEWFGEWAGIVRPILKWTTVDDHIHP